MVFHGYRTVGGGVQHLLGRETCLAPVTWTHITGWIVSEAKALLQHTDWNIADIAYALGFGYPLYFNNFFKRLTGTNPTALRIQPV